MRYADNLLLLAYARLQLQIARAKNPMAQMDVLEAGIVHTVGYKKLRAWFTHLGKKKQGQARAWLKFQIDGVRQIVNEAKRTGEDFTLADVEIDVVEQTTREPLPAPPSLEPDLPTLGDIDRNTEAG